MPTPELVKQAREFMLAGHSGSVSGWLLHDYRRSNPIFWQALGRDISNVTRPCFPAHTRHRRAAASWCTTWTQAGSTIPGSVRKCTETGRR